MLSNQSPSSAEPRQSLPEGSFWSRACLGILSLPRPHLPPTPGTPSPLSRGSRLGLISKYHFHSHCPLTLSHPPEGSQLKLPPPPPLSKPCFPKPVILDGIYINIGSSCRKKNISAPPLPVNDDVSGISYLWPFSFLALYSLLIEQTHQYWNPENTTKTT